MIARMAAAAAAVALVSALMTGCGGPAEPAEPTPHFTSEAEAFAAAEETYRAYVDALNRVDLSDPATFEDVYAWTTGELNATDRKGLSGYHADGVSVSGSSTVLLTQGVDFDSRSVSIAVCLDVSAVDVTSADGSSLVQDDRVDVQSLLAVLELEVSSPTGLLVAAIDPREGEPSCGP